MWALAPAVVHMQRTGDLGAALELAHEALSQRGVTIALLPFTVMIRPLFAAWPAGFALAAVPAVLLALASGLVEKGLRGGLIAIGGLNLGGGIETVPNALAVAEVAIEKGAVALLAPISARRQLNELSDDMATKLSILYYADAREALVKGLGE